MITKQQVTDMIELARMQAENDTAMYRIEDPEAIKNLMFDHMVAKMKSDRKFADFIAGEEVTRESVKESYILKAVMVPSLQVFQVTQGTIGTYMKPEVAERVDTAIAELIEELK